jgi:PAS domain S-box-containing protein
MAIAKYFEDDWRSKYEDMPERFARDAMALTEGLGGVQAVNWMDNDWVIQHVVPRKGNEGALKQNLHDHPSADVRNAVRKARETRTPARTTEPIKLFQGGVGFVSYYPLSSESGEALGFINIVFKVESIVKNSLSEASLRENYFIALIEDDGSVIYNSKPSAVPGSWRGASRSVFPVVDSDMSLVLAPRSQTAFFWYPNYLIVIFGVALATLDAWLTYGMAEQGRALRAKVRFSLRLLTNVHEGILLSNRESTVTYANPRIEEILGMDDLIGKPMCDVIPVSSLRDSGYGEHEGDLRTRYATLLRRDGTKARVQTRIVDLPDDNEFDAESMVTVWDVSEIVRAEDSLRERVQRLSDAEVAAHFGAYSADLETGELEMSSQCCQIFGYAREEVNSSPASFLRQVLHPNDRARIEDQMSQVAQSGKRFEEEFQIVRKDGESRFVRISGTTLLSPSGAPTRHTGIVQDVTELRIDSLIRRQTAYRYKTLIENLPHCVHEIDLDGNLISMNSVGLSMMNVSSEEEAINIPYLNAVSVADKARVSAMLDGAKAGESHFFEFEAAGEAPVSAYSSYFIPLLDDERNPYKIMGITIDITKERNRKRALETLVAEKRLLALAIDQADDAIHIMGPDRIILYCNPAFERLTGRPASVVMGTRAKADGLEEDEFKRMLSAMDEERAWNGTYSGISRDGKPFYSLITLNPVHDEDGTLNSFVVFQRDVTKERELEKRLQHADRLKAVGALAGGIAHDFNNILHSILGYTQLVSTRISRDDSLLVECMSEIEKGGKRAADLIKRILSFSRESDTAYASVRLQPLIQEALQFVRGPLPANVEIETEIGADCNSVLGDPTEIHQVIMNLCINASHAMEASGGVLRVVLEEVNLEEKDTAFDAELLPGRYASLKIEDTGCGMDERTLDKLFEPYFTTKEEERGTGLGLATVHGIVGRMKGSIRVASTLGEGSRFEILLPTSLDLEDSNDNVDPSEAPTPSIRGKVLIVDDEEAIRRMSEITLRNSNFTVDSYVNAESAGEKFRENPDYFDIVVTDLDLPGMNGLEFGNAIHLLRKDLPIILTTGTPNAINGQELSDSGFREVINKPFGPQEFLESIVRNLAYERDTT